MFFEHTCENQIYKGSQDIKSYYFTILRFENEELSGLCSVDKDMQLSDFNLKWGGELAYFLGEVVQEYNRLQRSKTVIIAKELEKHPLIVKVLEKTYCWFRKLVGK